MLRALACFDGGSIDNFWDAASTSGGGDGGQRRLTITNIELVFSPYCTHL